MKFLKSSKLILTSLFLISFAGSSNALVIELQGASAFSFQDEGTTNIDHTSQLQTVDNIFAPLTGGTVTQSYYATGTSPSYFDAVSLNFDLSGVGFDNIESATLRFLTQKGDYATVVDGAAAFNANNLWEHYQILEGAYNATNQDVGPIGTAGAIDFFDGGTANPNDNIGWIGAVIDASWLTSNNFDVTLRLWNARLDTVQLDVTVVPEPSIILLFGLGFVGLSVVRRRHSKES